MTDYEYSYIGEHGSLPQDGTDRHADFVSLFSVILDFEVDLLTVTWDSALETLGRGASGRVDQSLINRGRGLAYKRMEYDRLKPFQRSYRRVISEIIALKAPLVKESPYVIPLDGICWEIISEGALPVLIFPKTSHGNLREFLTSESGKSLSLADRKRLCAEIGKGLGVLHDSGVLHLDIKPDNILVDLSPDGEPIARIGDLGCAHIVKDEDDLLKLPRSRPWTDPRWHAREFTVSAARKMELYSYGMLCLWVLLEEELSEYLNKTLPVQQIGSNEQLFFIRNDREEKTELELLQEGDGLITAVRHILATTSNSENMTAFFDCLLSNDDTLRDISFAKLVSLLSEETPDPQSCKPQPVSSLLKAHNSFHVGACGYRLCSSDYRLRCAVVRALLLRTSADVDTYCEECSKEASFQLAFCYFLGLGTPKDEASCQSQLALSNRNLSQLEEDIEVMKKIMMNLPEQEGDGSNFIASRYMSLFDEGFVEWEDLPTRYRKDRVMAVAETTYKREISDMESVLGNGNPAVLHLKAVLVSMLVEQDRLVEAESVSREAMEAARTTLGENHSDTIEITDRLIDIVRMQSRYTEARGLAKSLLNMRLLEKGPDHPTSLRVRVTIANIDRCLRRWKSAEEGLVDLIAGFTSSFGYNHRETLIAKSYLQAVYIDQGQFRKALAPQKELIDSMKPVFSTGDRALLIEKAHLARIYFGIGRLVEAKSQLLEALEEARESLGEADKLYLGLEGELSSLYDFMEDFDGAEEFKMKVIMRFFNLNHEIYDYDTLIRLADLGEFYVDRGHLRQAYRVVYYVLDQQAKIITHKPQSEPDSTPFIARLRVSGESDGLESLEFPPVIKFSDFGTDLANDTSLSALSVYGAVVPTLIKLDALQQAKELLIEAVDGYKTLLAPEDEKTVQQTLSLAAVYTKMGDPDSAWTLLTEVRQIRESKYGIDDVLSLSIIKQLAQLMDHQGRDEEALGFCEELYKSSSRILGPVHVQAVDAMVNLSDLYVSRMLWGKIESLSRDLFLSEEFSDDIGPAKASMIGTQLLKAYQEQGKWTDAVIVVKKMLRLAEGDGKDGDLGPRVVYLVAQLATILAEIGEIEGSIVEFKRAIQEIGTMANHPHRQIALAMLPRLAICYFNEGKKQVCQSLLEEVLELAVRLLGPDHQFTLVTRRYLDVVEQALAQA